MAPPYAQPGQPGQAGAFPTPSGADSPAKRAFRGGRLGVVVAAGFLVVVALGGVGAWALGGLKEARQPIPTTAVGKPVDQGLFHTTVLAAVVRDQKGPGGKVGRYLDLDLRVTNTGDRSMDVTDYLATAIVVLPGYYDSTGLVMPQMKTGGTETHALEPDTPTVMRLPYPVSRKYPAPGRLDIRMCGYQKVHDFFYGHQWWQHACPDHQNLGASASGRKHNAYDRTGVIGQVFIDVKKAR